MRSRTWKDMPFGSATDENDPKQQFGCCTTATSLPSSATSCAGRAGWSRCSSVDERGRALLDVLARDVVPDPAPGVAQWDRIRRVLLRLRPDDREPLMPVGHGARGRA